MNSLLSQVHKPRQILTFTSWFNSLKALASDPLRTIDSLWGAVDEKASREHVSASMVYRMDKILLESGWPHSFNVHCTLYTGVCQHHYFLDHLLALSMHHSALLCIYAIHFFSSSFYVIFPLSESPHVYMYVHTYTHIHTFIPTYINA
jgi:hypothetical protein